jgi:hypothetical protein
MSDHDAREMSFTLEEYIHMVLSTTAKMLASTDPENPDQVREFCMEQYHSFEVLRDNPNEVVECSRSVHTMTDAWNETVITTIHAMIKDEEIEVTAFAQLQHVAAMIAFGFDVVSCAVQFIEEISSILNDDERSRVIEAILEDVMEGEHSIPVCEWLGGGEA